MSSIITLENTSLRLGLDPARGGGIVYLQFRRRSGEWIHLMKIPEDVNPALSSWFMAGPGPGRTAASLERPGVLTTPYGDFALGGEESKYRRGYAIHGVARNHPHAVLDQSADQVKLLLDTRAQGVARDEWPWSMEVSSMFSISMGSLLCTRAMRCLDGPSPMPADHGEHPFFRRSLIPGLDSELQVQFVAKQMFAPTAVDGQVILLPFEAPRDIPSELSFAKLRPVPFGLDHCFHGIEPIAEDPFEYIKLRWEKSGITAVISLHPATYQDIVVYSPEGGNHGPDYVAVEWQSCAPNAAALSQRGVSGVGPKWLSAGEESTTFWSLKAFEDK